MVDPAQLRRLAVERKDLLLWQRLKGRPTDGFPVGDPAVVFSVLRAVVGAEPSAGSARDTTHDFLALFRTIERLGRAAAAQAESADASPTADLTALHSVDLVEHLATLHLRTLGEAPGTKLSLLAFMLAADSFLDVMELSRARTWYEEARARSASRFPEIHYPAIYGLAVIDALELRLGEAEEGLRSLTDGYFRVPSNAVLAGAFLLRGEVLLRQGRFGEATGMLLRSAATRGAPYHIRARAVRRLAVAYRRPSRLLSDRRIPLPHRLVLAAVTPAFSATWLWKRQWAFRPGVSTGLRLLLSLLRTGPSSVPRHASRILIARSSGGIGDLLMMTPALAELRRRLPRAHIDFAVPARYFPLFDGNRDFRLLDVDGPLRTDDYDCCISWSDCPASRVETRTAPRVRTSRIQAFAASLGCRELRDARPRYAVSEEEQAFADAFWREHGLGREPVVAVQYRAAEPYRDYPHMDAVIRALAARGRTVMVFHDEPLGGLRAERVLVIDRLPLRRAVALLARCALLIAPDSAFVHLAGALGMPAIAIYGPISGEVRTRHYPSVQVLQERFGCVPCWRHQEAPCALTDGMDSPCLSAIPPEAVLERIDRQLAPGGHPEAR